MSGPHVVILDNYDSFTFNLAQAFAGLGARVTVHRSDQLTLSDLEALAPDHLVISPGPGGPAGTGIGPEALARFRGRLPVLGVCLGHQLISASLGAEVVPARSPVHGKPWPIHHRGEGLFEGLESPFLAARYHSLTVLPQTLDPDRAAIRAWTTDGEIMAIEVPGEPTWGVQFHPESYLTPSGPRLLAGFLALDGRHPATACL